MLSLQDIVVSRGRHIVIERSSAEADKGNIVALLGPNGSGKTTLLHFISGVLEGDSGEVYYDGSKVVRTSPDWRTKLSYVADDGGIIPLLTVEEQLFLQCSLAGVEREAAIERANHILELLDLGKHRSHRGDELSAGLTKRLGIGLGIICEAEILLFDEPFSALDVPTLELFNRLIIFLKQKMRIVIIAPHSFPYLDRVCNRVWNIKSREVSDISNEQESRRLLSDSLKSEKTSYEELDLPWIH